MPLSDAALVHQVRGGNTEAFGLLVDRHSARLSRYALHLLGNRADAEEAVQEALVRAFRSLARYEEREQFGAWLLRILVNRCRTLASRRRDFEPLEAASLVWHPGEDPVEALSVREELGHALSQLSPEHREAIALRFGEDLSFAQMATVTGAGIPALKMRVRRACDRLRALLEESRARV
ncbi:MAG: RNA polymerase sigma factor [Gemmatimonadaceae bacterium]